MLTTCLLLLSLTGAPTTGSQDQEPTCAELTKAYDKAALDWRRAQRAARKAKEDFEDPHPIQEYFGRFQEYADAGDPQALLWIGTNVDPARKLGATEPDPDARQNLLDMADMNEQLVTQAPDTFREACQWIGWFDMAARMYNGSGSLGRLDVLLESYHEGQMEANEQADW